MVGSRLRLLLGLDLRGNKRLVLGMLFELVWASE